MATNIVRHWNNRVIRQREDGYLSGTDMAQANGKLIGHWLALKSTTAFLQEMSRSITIAIDQLVEVNESQGLNEDRGTWIHPEVFPEFERWAFKSKTRFPQQHLYVVGTEDNLYIKIGISSNPLDRIQKLERSCPSRLKLLFSVALSNAKDVEQALHARLADFNTNGEWFDAIAWSMVDWSSLNQPIN